MQNYYQTIFENTRIAIFVLNKELKIVTLNRMTEELLGYTREELIGINPFDKLVHPEYTGPLLEHYRLRVAGLGPEVPREYEMKYVNKAGQVNDCIATVTYLSHYESFIISVLDITQRKKTEMFLKESELRFRQIYENSSDSMFIIDISRDERASVTGFNAAAEKLTGIKSEDICDKEIGQVFDTKTAKALMENYMRCIEAETTISYEETLDLPAGKKTLFTTLIPLSNKEGRFYRIIGMAHDITKIKKSEKANNRLLDQLVHSLSTYMESRDPYTAGHQKKVAHLASKIAEEMGLSANKVIGLSVAALLHDIGKIIVPTEILCKPGRLSEVEYSLIKEHCRAGYNILKNVEFPWPVSEIILQHHERMDGSGYPRGLAGEEILLEARILAVADVVESMSSYRPYRAPLGIEKALEEITKNKGSLFDEKAVDSCMRLFLEKEFVFEKSGHEADF